MAALILSPASCECFFSVKCLSVTTDSLSVMIEPFLSCLIDFLTFFGAKCYADKSLLSSERSSMISCMCSADESLSNGTYSGLFVSLSDKEWYSSSFGNGEKAIVISRIYFIYEFY